MSVWNNLDTALAEVAKGIYQMVEKRARRLAGIPEPVMPPQFPLFMLDYARNPFFTDRADTLATLHHDFTSGQIIQTRTQALDGMAGMGKTLLAVEYAWHYHREYQAVLWLNAHRELLSVNILSLARKLGIPAQEDVDEQQRFAVIQWWLQRHDRWLFVLDNLDDFSIVEQLIPLCSNGHVLLITHSRAIGPLTSVIPIAPMTIDDGALLLLRRARIIPAQGSRDAASETDYHHAREIAREVEGYPLALDQVGAYLYKTGRSPASYLELYHQQQITLSGERGSLGDHPDPVMTTLSVNFNQIEQTDRNALKLLHFFAFLYPEALPDKMITDGASVLRGPLRTLALDPSAFDDAITTLRKFSLVYRSADTTTLNLHRLVQAVLKKLLLRTQQLQLANQAVRLINAIFPEVRFETWKECERYVSQAQHCASLITDYRLTVKEGPLLLERLGFYYFQQGCYAAAESCLTQALQLQERHTDPLDLARTLNSLGLLSQRQARYHDAEAFHQRALDLRKHAPKPDHLKTAQSLHNLALLYGDLGEYQRAEQLYLDVLSLQERLQGADHPDVARTLNNLAQMYYHQGRYSQAKITYQHALAICERSLPAGHPDMIYPLDGLGALAEVEGNYQEAGEFYRQALAISDQAFGEKHPETAHCVNKVADAAESQDNYPLAEPLYRRALSIGEQALGPEHPDVALFLNNLAFLVHRQGQYQEAEDLYLRALNIYEQALGPEHPYVANVLNNLGQLYYTIKNEKRAEELYRRALAIYEQHANSTRSDIAQVLSDLADRLAGQHRYEEAEPLYKRALPCDTKSHEMSEAKAFRQVSMPVPNPSLRCW